MAVACVSNSLWARGGKEERVVKGGLHRNVNNSAVFSFFVTISIFFARVLNPVFFPWLWPCDFTQQVWSLNESGIRPVSQGLQLQGGKAGMLTGGWTHIYKLHTYNPLSDLFSTLPVLQVSAEAPHSHPQGQFGAPTDISVDVFVVGGNQITRRKASQT